MNESLLLRDYESKWGRAMHHFDVLRKAVERFKNIDHEPVLGEFDADASQYAFEVPLKNATPNGHSFSGTTSTTLVLRSTT